MQETFAYRIRGGHPVRGEIKTLGAKNFATKAMVAALLSAETTTLTNVPPIGDTDITQIVARADAALGQQSDSDFIARRVTASLERGICPRSWRLQNRDARRRFSSRRHSRVRRHHSRNGRRLCGAATGQTARRANQSALSERAHGDYKRGDGAGDF
ncbi:MAG: hypothetical protein DCC52_18210 [Chloroflexi bacterium]|nr:MAG: hypothetical protein DCC52_18210 [Chloroflexota bacterium]